MSEDDLDATISRTMEALRVYRGLSAPELQIAVGIKPSTYFSRRRGLTPWTAAEVKRAADALGVNVATLYDGLSVAGAGFEPATSGLRAHERISSYCQVGNHEDCPDLDCGCWCGHTDRDDFALAA